MMLMVCQGFKDVWRHAARYTYRLFCCRIAQSPACLLASDVTPARGGSFLVPVLSALLSSLPLSFAAFPSSRLSSLLFPSLLCFSSLSFSLPLRPLSSASFHVSWYTLFQFWSWTGWEGGGVFSVVSGAWRVVRTGRACPTPTPTPSSAGHYRCLPGRGSLGVPHVSRHQVSALSCCSSFQPAR